MASRFPNELYESIISNFSPPTTLSTASCRSTIPTLKSLSLVSQAFRSFAQSHLFSTFHLDCEVKGLKGKCKLLALDEYRLARYVRILRINLYVIHQAGVDEIVESVVPHFTRIVEVEISGAGAFVGSARCERWASCRDSHSSLRYVFAREVFPRVRRLMMECFLDLPMGHALMTCGKLKHLSLRQIGGGVCSCGDEDENVPKANEGCPPHPLESLMIGTYCAEDFEIGGPLMNFLDQSRCSIRKIQLGSHVNTLFHSLSSLSSVENMFSRCASTLTHLHLGAELYRKLVRLQTSDIERINLARFTALEVLQAELVLYGADERFHGARVYPGDGLWWRGSDYFFSWLATELKSISSRTRHPLQSIIMDVRVDAPLEWERTTAKVDWSEFEEIVCEFGAMVDVVFRMRRWEECGKKFLMEALSDLDGRKMLRLQRWK